MRKMFFKYAMNRLSESSTIRHIVLFIGSILGLTLTDSQTNFYVWILLSVVSLFGTILPDRMSKEDQPEVTPNQSDYPETGWGDK